MNAKQLLEQYIWEHPDYWDYDDEIEEVIRLKELCDKELIEQENRSIKSHYQLPLCV